MKAKEGSLVSDVAESYTCGYPVPNLQRDLCWSRSQDVRFIESAWLGLKSGHRPCIKWIGRAFEATLKHWGLMILMLLNICFIRSVSYGFCFDSERV
jgi:hypothetical protein